MSEPIAHLRGKHMPPTPHRDGKKLCTRCCEWVDISCFSKHSQTWDRLHPACNGCMNARRRNQAHAKGVLPQEKRRTPYNGQGQKWCKKCSTWKAPEEFASDCSKFDGHSTKCKLCDSANQRALRQTNSEKVRAHAREYQKTRFRDNIQYRLRTLCKNRIWWALGGVGKAGKTEALVGCSMLQLKEHLERQFVSGMSWENYGSKGWHIDHIRPCSSFDLTQQEQQRKCFHYTNLRPLWAADNFSKSDKWDGEEL